MVTFQPGDLVTVSFDPEHEVMVIKSPKWSGFYVRPAGNGDSRTLKWHYNEGGYIEAGDLSLVWRPEPDA